MPTIEELQTSLIIDKNDLDTAIMNQPDLYYRVCEETANARDSMDRAKSELDAAAAGADLRIRDEATRTGTKITEGYVNAKVLQDPTYDVAMQHLSETKNMAERWNNLREAFQQRSQMLKLMCDLYASNYFTLGAIRGNAANSRMETAAKTGREAMRSSRKPLNLPR